MLRSFLCRSQNASRNLAVTRISKKKTQTTPSLTSLSRFSYLESSGYASARNIRFFSASPPTEENPVSLPTDEIPISSAAELTLEESVASALGFSESGDYGGTSVEAVGEDGDSEIVAIENEVYQFDDEKLESVLSLLRSDEESLEFGLNALNVDLHLDFVVRVFESPGISGKNLIRFLKWATEREEITVTTSLVESLLVAIAGDTRRMDAYGLWDLVKEIGEKENSSVLNLEILKELIALCGIGYAMYALRVLYYQSESRWVKTQLSGCNVLWKLLSYICLLYRYVKLADLSKEKRLFFVRAWEVFVIWF